jgi:hypothetical protein
MPPGIEYWESGEEEASSWDSECADFSDGEPEGEPAWIIWPADEDGGGSEIPVESGDDDGDGGGSEIPVESSDDDGGGGSEIPLGSSDDDGDGGGSEIPVASEDDGGEGSDIPVESSEDDDGGGRGAAAMRIFKRWTMGRYAAMAEEQQRLVAPVHRERWGAHWRHEQFKREWWDSSSMNYMNMTQRSVLHRAEAAEMVKLRAQEKLKHERLKEMARAEGSYVLKLMTKPQEQHSSTSGRT